MVWTAPLKTRTSLQCSDAFNICWSLAFGQCSKVEHVHFPFSGRTTEFFFNTEQGKDICNFQYCTRERHNYILVLYKRTSAIFNTAQTKYIFNFHLLHSGSTLEPNPWQCAMFYTKYVTALTSSQLKNRITNILVIYYPTYYCNFKTSQEKDVRNFQYTCTF